MVHVCDFKRFARDAYGVLRRPMTLIIWGVCTLMVAVAGPFGTFDVMIWPMRLLYWSLVSGLGLFLVPGASAAALVLTGDERPLWHTLLTAVLAAVVLAPVIRLLREVTDPGRAAADMRLASIGFNTFVIVGGVLILCRVIAGGVMGPAAPEARLLRRLPETSRGRILRLSAKDHFVQVVTDAGRETLRLRLSDAIAEAEPEAGLCIHRSHWVAGAAIAGVEQDARKKVFVVLVNGDRVPVSRKYLAALQDAGWVPRVSG